MEATQPPKYPEFKAGVYRHYKGPLYQVFGLAHDANDEKRTAVLYIALQLDQAQPGPRFCVRTYEDFYCYVDPVTKEACDKSQEGATPRFEYVGDTWQGEL